MSCCDCGIDVHAHVVPETFPTYLGEAAPAAWPSTAMAPSAGGLCHRHIMISGKNFRTVSEKCWSASRRLADLAGMGLARQVVSPMPELLSYWFEPRAACQLLRFLNEHIATLVDESGGSLLGLGAVPLQDLDLAIAELRHGMETLGLKGVEIGSNVGGVPIGDPRFLPFFEACETLGAWAAEIVARVGPARGRRQGAKRRTGRAPVLALQRWIRPHAGPTLRAEAIQGPIRRCRLVVWLATRPRQRLVSGPDSLRRGPRSLPPTLLGAAVFVHALKPTGMDRLVGPAPLQQVLAYPTDVGLAAASVVTANLMLRCPRLRIAFSHGGGTLASLLPRLQQGWSIFPALREQVEQAPVEQARRLYFDTLVFDAPMLRHLVTTFGDTQLMLGSDYPFDFHDRTPVARIDAAGFDPEVRARLVHRNAERFLGLPHEATA